MKDPAAAVARRECVPQVHAMVAEFDRRRKFLHSALSKVHGWKIAAYVDPGLGLMVSLFKSA